MTVRNDEEKGESNEIGGARRGREYERAVAEVQQLLDPQSVVEHDVRLRDHLGNLRQFDVVVRGTLGGRALFGVFECRDHARPVDQTQVDGFVTKMRSVNANFGVIVSRSGFGKPALESTRHYGIGAYSLLKQSGTEPGFTMLGHWYATVWDWPEVRWSFLCEPPSRLPEVFDDGRVVYGKLNLKAWVLDFLQAHSDGLAEGWHRLVARCREARTLTVDGLPVSITAFQVDARRVCYHKRREMQWTGKAMYDWHRGVLMVPPSTALQAWVQGDLYDWDDYSGPMPPPPEPGSIATPHLLGDLLLGDSPRPAVADLGDDVDLFFFPVPSGEPIPPVTVPTTH